MKRLHALAAISLATLFLAPQPVMAGAGHEHGQAAPTASGTALPRFAAVSELYELVGVLKGKQITMYLDRAADNSPVSEAQIELEIGGKKFKAAKQGADEFEVVLPEVPKPGVMPITATVSAGADADLLAAELDIHEAGHTDEGSHVHSWKDTAAWALGGLAGLAVLTALGMVGRRLLASRQVRAGAAT